MKSMQRSGVERRLGNRRGQGLVEFVLISPILLLLIFGMIEFARAWNIRHVVTDAAREGARFMAVDNGVSSDSVRVVINNAMLASGLNPANATVTLVECEGPGCASPTTRLTGQAARVTINYTYQLGIVRVLLGWAVQNGELNIGSTFVMRNE